MDTISLIVTVFSGSVFFFLFLVGLEKDKDLLSPFCIMTYWYVYFFYIPYLIAVYGGVNIWDLANFEWLTNIAMIHVVISYLAFSLAYMKTNKTVLIKQVLLTGFNIKLTRDRARVIGGGLFLFGLLNWGLFVHMNGGLMELFAAPDIWQFRTALNTLRHWILLQVGLISGLALYIAGVNADSTRSQAPVVYAMAISMAIIFILSHTRTRALAPLMFGVLFHHYYVKQIKPRYLLLLGTAGMTIVGLFTQIEALLIGAGLSLDIQFLEKFFYNYYFQNYAGLISYVPEVVDHALGRGFNIVPWFNVWPLEQLRSLQADYATIVEISVKGEDLPEVGESAGGLGKWYFNFGLIGVIAIPTVIGFASRVCYLCWNLTDRSVVTTSIYLIFLHYLFFIFAGDLFSYIHYVILLPILLLALVFDTQIEG